MKSRPKSNRRLSLTAAAAIFGSLALGAPPALAQTAGKATPFLPIPNEAPAKLAVDQPLAAPLARGVAIIPYRTENFRIVPIFGAAAREVTPRAGHLHVTVDNLPWHWADAGDNATVVVADLPAGPHSVLIELALPDHQVIAGERVAFVVPEMPKGSGHAAGHR